MKNINKALFKMIIGVIQKELDRKRYYLIALAWLLMMVFFTYTVILSESMMAGSSFYSVHWSNQNSLISMVVNCGMLFMIVFDYMLAGKSVPNTMVWVIFFGIVLAIGIYGHSGIMFSGSSAAYKSPLNCQSFTLWLHLVFLFVLLWLKERAVELDMSEIEIVDDYNG